PKAPDPGGVARVDGVQDFKLQAVGRQVPGHVDTYRAAVVGEAVDHRILDQRLQDQTRHPDRGHIGAVLHVHREAVREAADLQAEIELDELQLVAQLREVALPRLQQAPQQVAERGNQTRRDFGLTADARLNGVQDVEEGVG